MRFNTTPPPAPSWDRHLDTESRLMLELRGSIPTVVQRDLGDENDCDDPNDGLEVMDAC